MNITNQIPGGNVRVLSQTGNTVFLEQEQRDSTNEWIYWKFKAEFPNAGTWIFRFSKPYKVGERGPCISRDGGRSWNWQTDNYYADSQSFTYESQGCEEVWFCQAFPYMMKNWEDFTVQYRTNPAFSVSELARTKKGRSVPLVTIRKGCPEHTVMLTARHHCQESMASYVLEGFLATALASENCTLYAIPFVDLDGAEDGDQGKGRAPRDHGRDYLGEAIWPECAAIRKLAEEVKPFVIFDLHCPWIRDGMSPLPHFVEGPSAENRREIARIAELLESEAPAEAPFRRDNIIRWGMDWNTAANAKNCKIPGLGFSQWGARQGFAKLSVSLETPFANFGEKTIRDTEMRRYGAALFRAFRRYTELYKGRV